MGAVSMDDRARRLPADVIHARADRPRSRVAW
jgi:hypothetical protein